MWVEILYIASVVCALLLALYAAVSDWRFFKIPNTISLAVAFLFIPAVLTSPVEISWGVALITAGIAFAIGFALFAMGLFGGGDVKLIAALCLWAHGSLVMPFLLGVALAGALLVFAVLIRHAWHSEEEYSFFRRIIIATRSKTPVPYGVAIATGSLFVFYHYLKPINLFG